MTVEEEILSTEELLTVRWRRTCFISLGVDRNTADLLANGATDWHELAALVGAGCPLDVAIRILLLKWPMDAVEFVCTPGPASSEQFEPRTYHVHAASVHRARIVMVIVGELLARRYS